MRGGECRSILELPRVKDRCSRLGSTATRSPMEKHVRAVIKPPRLRASCTRACMRTYACVCVRTRVTGGGLSVKISRHARRIERNDAESLPRPPARSSNARLHRTNSQMILRFLAAAILEEPEFSRASSPTKRKEIFLNKNKMTRVPEETDSSAIADRPAIERILPFRREERSILVESRISGILVFLTLEAFAVEFTVPGALGS